LERREQLADATAPAPAELRKENAVVEPQPPAVDARRADKATVTGETPVRQEAAAERSRALNESVIVGGAQGALRAAGGLLTVSADGAARWRRAGATIEFAAQPNANFVAAALPVGADAIVAASAPGGTVCWMAGRAGIVVVTTDGVRFTRVGTPAAVDLTGIAAADARTATVTAADGRRFRTTDAGATWTALP
jgi:hypothetical protein